MNERSISQFALLVANQIALRGLTKHPLSNCVPDEHQIRLVTTIENNKHTQEVIGPRLFEVTFKIADYDVYDNPLGSTLSSVFTHGSLDDQVQELWGQWEVEGQPEWVGQDSVMMFSRVGRERNSSYMNTESLFVDNRLWAFYGQLITYSQLELGDLHGFAISQYFRTAAIRLGACLKQRQHHWSCVLDQLTPLNKRY